MREYLVRLIYCEMLGHDASTGYVEAIKFAQQPNSLDKRVGKCLSCAYIVTYIVSLCTSQLKPPPPRTRGI